MGLYKGLYRLDSMDQIGQQRLRQFGCITARRLPIIVPYRLISEGISGLLCMGFPEMDFRRTTRVFPNFPWTFPLDLPNKCFSCFGDCLVVEISKIFESVSHVICYIIFATSFQKTNILINTVAKTSEITIWEIQRESP